MSKKKKILFHLIRNEDIEFSFSNGKLGESILRNIILGSEKNLYDEIYCFYIPNKIDKISFTFKGYRWILGVKNLGYEDVKINKSKIFNFTVFENLKGILLKDMKIIKDIYFLPLNYDDIKDYEKLINIEEIAQKNEVHFIKVERISNNNVDVLTLSEKLKFYTIKLKKDQESNFNILSLGIYDDSESIQILEDEIKLILQPEEFKSLVTEDQKMIELKYDAKFYSKLKEPILIVGETGTGKELFAQAVHKCGKLLGEFVAVNCAAIPDNLFESEMFGYIKGAFTGANENKIGKFELANEGTLFLDEIGELSLDNQTKLLRAIQENEILRIGENKPIKTNFRLICATNKDISDENIFRSDLLNRINTLELKIPPLRNRTLKDKEILTNQFLKELKKKNPNCDHINFKFNSRKFIYTYEWQGNVRELKNFISKAFYNAVQWYSPCIEDKFIEDYKNRSTINKKTESVIQNTTENDNEKIFKEISIESELKNGVNLKNILENLEEEYIDIANKISKTAKIASTKIGYSDSKFSKRKKYFNNKKKKTYDSNKSD